MKYKLNEQQLNNLITNSTMRVLSEAMEDEGLGNFLGNLAGRIRNGINKFSGDFNAARNNQLYQKRNYDSYQNYGYDPNSRNFDPNTARQYQDAKNAGASRASMGSYATQYGDTVQGAQYGQQQQGNPQGGQQGGPQNNPQMQQQPQQQQPQMDNDQLMQLSNQMQSALNACKKAGLVMQKNGNNRQFVTKDGSQRTPQQDQLVQAYMQAYNLWRNGTGAKNQLNISESKLSNIIKESVKKVLNEIGDTAQGQYMLGRLAARQAKESGDWNWKCNTTEYPAWQYAQKQLEKKYPNAYDRIAKDIPLNAGAYHQEQLYDEPKYTPKDEYTKRVKDNIRNQYNDYKQNPNYLDDIK